jgi:hypothetical protein
MTEGDWRAGDALTATEEMMRGGSEVGGLVGAGSGPYGLAAMRAWGSERTVRSAVLRHLLVSEEWPVHAKGVLLRGLRISGQLDLEGAVLRCPLLLDSCYVPEPVVLAGATVSLLGLRKCYVAGLQGDALVVTRYLDMAGSTFAGTLRLASADITGGVSCRGAHLANPGEDGAVLVAEDMKVGSYVFMDQGFTSEGTVSLARASIGYLSCRGARMGTSKGANALFAERMKVGGEVFLDTFPGQSSFMAEGTVWLAGADIAGHLICDGAQLKGSDKDGNALFGGGMKVGGNVILGRAFTAVGAIDLRGAGITGNLDCRGAQLNGVNKDGNALHADGTTVGGHALLNEGFTAAGAVCLVDAEVAGNVECRGAQLSGANKDGNALHAERMQVGGDGLLDKGFTAAGAVWLRGARIAGQLSCRGARIGAGKDGDSALVAERMTVGSDVFLDTFPGQSEFTAEGTVRLAGADIAGVLSCNGGRLHGADNDGNALSGGGMKVGGSGGLLLAEMLASKGALDLRGADITGNLNCCGARLNAVNKDGNVLDADRATIGGHILLNDEFTAAGTIYLLDAEVGGNLECRGARLTNPANRGRALYAERMKVGGDVYLDTPVGKSGFSAAGTIYLLSADIGGVLSCRGAQLMAPSKDGHALFAERMKVGGNVYLTQGFTAAGNLQLRSATVGGSLEIEPSKLSEDETKSALDATGAQISGKLRWAPQEQVVGQVNLEGTAVGQLEDSWAEPDGGQRPNGYWPAGGRLRIDGLTYDNIVGDHQANVGQRLEWIRSQYRPKVDMPRTDTLGRPGILPARDENFAAQPYKQLVQAYQQAGKDTEARAVAIARQRDLRKYGHLTWYRNIFNRLLDFFIGYGYQTWKAGVYLVILYVGVLAVVFFAQSHDGIAPTQNTALLYPSPTALRCTSDYPCFNPVGYAIDTVIPLINVHQADFWGPDASAAAGGVLLYFTWVAIGFGWLLATFAVAGATGLVRRTDLS